MFRHRACGTAGRSPATSNLACPASSPLFWFLLPLPVAAVKMLRMRMRTQRQMLLGMFQVSYMRGIGE